MPAEDERDVVDLLVDQHNQIRTLFAEVESARGAHKRDLFQGLVRLLAVHESAEEVVVHPTALSEIGAGEEVVQARLQEEDEAKHALVELYDLGVDSPEFDQKLVALAKSVAEHADEEEREEFVRLREQVPRERLRTMADALRMAETIAATRPHPHAGESAMANLFAGHPSPHSTVCATRCATGGSRSANERFGPGERDQISMCMTRKPSRPANSALVAQGVSRARCASRSSSSTTRNSTATAPKARTVW